MIQSFFKYLQPHIADNKIKGLKKLLKEIGVYEHFADIPSDSVEEWEQISSYILFAYCPDSSYVTSNSDWFITKKEIFDLCGLDEEKHAFALHLQDQSVKDAIRSVGETKNDWRHWQIITWKEAVIILDKIATTIPAADQKSPAKVVYDAAKFSEELKRKISKMEEEINKTTRSTGRLGEVKEIESDNNSYEKLLKEELRNNRKN
jgi:hypothetical protein